MGKNKNRKIFRQRAQSTLEYAMVVACLVAALLAMQIYIKRGVQGRLRDAANDIGEQYSAKNTTSNLSQSYTSDVTVIGTPRFVPVDGERKEIMEITRDETVTVGIGGGSYEQTGKLSDESLF